MTKQEVADRFLAAGRAELDITIDDLKVIGMNEMPKAKDWYQFCDAVHRHISGRPIGMSPFRGIGRTSRWLGEQVSSAILES